MKTVGEVLKNNTILGKLIKKSQLSNNLSLVFHNMLDADFSKHCHFANIEDSTIIVTVTNASWATKLRYAIPDVIKNLRTQPEFKNITNIRYSINYQKYKTKYKTKKRQMKLSTDNQVLWQDTLTNLKKKTPKTTWKLR